MSTLTVIILILLVVLGHKENNFAGGFRMYKYPRSVDTSQFSTQSPCPTVFQYQNDENGNLVGFLKIDQIDSEGKVQLDVELSVGNTVQGYNGKITLADEKQKVINDIMNRKSIFYRVHFPVWQNIPPKITKIMVNGNIICTGPRIPIQMVPVLTMINLQHKLSLGVTPLSSGSDPGVQTTFNDPGNQNIQYIIDVRSDDTLPTVPNNIFADNSDSGVTIRTAYPSQNVNNPFNFDPERSVPPPQPTRRHTRPQNPYLNVNNPYNFNPGPPQWPPPPPPHIPPYPFSNIYNPYNFNPPPPPPPPPPPRHGPPNNPYNFHPGAPPPPPPPRQGGGPPPPPPGDRWPPPPPPGDRWPPPPPDGRPPPPPPPDDGWRPQVQINPNNPFLNGLSTPEPPRRGGSATQSIANNPFLPQRTETPVFAISTSTPPRDGGFSNGGSFTGNLNDICGRPIPTNSLIVNGQSVPRGAYPWLVAIFRQLDNLSLSYICSGSLISERHVVTAAHCLRFEYRRVKPNEIVCVFGKLNIRKWVSAPGERTLEPESITIHPQYQPGKADADIAVMTFQDPIPFSKTIMPVCLWQGSTELNDVVGDIGTVVGWGRDENGDVSTAEPRQVNLPIVGQFECLKNSSSTAGQALVEIVSANTFCAGFRNGSGPCNGDSGSAFLLRKNGVFYLRGVVSTALSELTHKSCNLLEYVVFTDASKYLDWLLRIVRQS